MFRSALLVVLSLSFVYGETPKAPVASDPPMVERDFLNCCWAGQTDRVTEFLKQGVSLEATDQIGRTPLALACHGNPELVKLLLDHGAKVNVRTLNGDTPFSLACEHGILPSAQMLFARGALLSTANRWGRTPLMLAAREGHDDVVAFLIQQYADVNARDNIDYNALFHAVDRKHLSVAKLLLDAGAVCTRPNPPLSAPNPDTLMMIAAFTYDQDMIDLLLTHGAQLDERNRRGISALLQLCMSGESDATINHLLEKGADPNVADNTGETALIAAVEEQHVSIDDALLQHGARINAQDHDGKTALIWAASFNNPEHVRTLLAAKPDVNIVDAKGETALTYAGDRGGVAIVQWLKDAGATRTDLHIIPKTRADPPLSTSQLWALAVGAMYAQYNGYSHEAVFEPDMVDSNQKVLKDQWDIKNKAELLHEVAALEKSRDWKDFYGGQLEDILSKPGRKKKFFEAEKIAYLDLKWRQKMDRAWDLCRAANLVRLGMNTGLITPAEGWPLLKDVARQTQRTFGSWQEMCDNFLDGRMIWAGGTNPEFTLRASLLLNPKDPNSPWMRLPWNTDLNQP